MNARLTLIRQRRQLLLARVAVQRLAVVQHVEALRTPLAVADAAIAAASALSRHPWVIAFALAFLFKTPRYRLSLWATRLLTGWKLWGLYRAMSAEWSRGRAS